MTINVGVNGMGRIGRMVIRAIIESQNKNIKIKHINNRSNSEASCTLIKYDSVHGKFNADLDYDDNHLIINKNKITFSQESKIENINWNKFGVDYVFECTGKFNSKEKLVATNFSFELNFPVHSKTSVSYTHLTLPTKA